MRRKNGGLIYHIISHHEKGDGFPPMISLFPPFYHFSLVNHDLDLDLDHGLEDEAGGGEKKKRSEF